MTLGFQSAEHQRIGDNIRLQYSNGKTISGRDFGYEIGSCNLSYGLVCALAGDFYGHYKLFGDAEQISDKWDSDPEGSIARFLKNAGLLSGDVGGNLSTILQEMASQEHDVLTAQDQGKDPAQVCFSSLAILKICFHRILYAK